MSYPWFAAATKPKRRGERSAGGILLSPRFRSYFVPMLTATIRRFPAQKLITFAILSLIAVFLAPSARGAEPECKAACDVPDIDACGGCSVTCAMGQAALCTPGVSTGNPKKCTQKAACKCLGEPSHEHDCGVGCNYPFLLGQACGTCSVICPRGQIASCHPGQATDMFVPGKTGTCTLQPRCGCG